MLLSSPDDEEYVWKLTVPTSLRNVTYCHFFRGNWQWFHSPLDNLQWPQHRIIHDYLLLNSNATLFVKRITCIDSLCKFYPILVASQNVAGSAAEGDKR